MPLTVHRCGIGNKTFRLLPKLARRALGVGTVTVWPLTRNACSLFRGVSVSRAALDTTVVIARLLQTVRGIRRPETAPGNRYVTDSSDGRSRSGPRHRVRDWLLRGQRSRQRHVWTLTDRYKFPRAVGPLLFPWPLVRANTSPRSQLCFLLGLCGGGEEMQ